MPPAVAPLAFASRQILKGTLVPVQVREASGAHSLTKYGTIRQLATVQGEMDAVSDFTLQRGHAATSQRNSSELMDVLRRFERAAFPALRPALNAVAAIPAAELASGDRGARGRGRHVVAGRTCSQPSASTPAEVRSSFLAARTHSGSHEHHQKRCTRPTGGGSARVRSAEVPRQRVRTGAPPPGRCACVRAAMQSKSLRWHEGSARRCPGLALAHGADA